MTSSISKRHFTFRFLCLLFCFLISPVIRSQGDVFLLLDKPGTLKRIKKFPGDELSVSVDDEKYAITGLITAIKDSSVYIDGLEIPVSRIHTVYNHKLKRVSRGLSKGAFLAIPPALLFTAANNLFNTGEQPLIDRNALSLTGIFAGVGLAGLLVPSRKYKIYKKWRVRILDVSPG